MSRTIGALAALLLVPALGGCGSGVAPIEPADLAAEISARMEEEVGIAPAVECPSQLPARVGATVTCTITASEAVTTALVVHATVTEVDVEKQVVVFDIAVSTASESSPLPSSATPS